MSNTLENIKKNLLEKKADENNTIDLNAYAIGLNEMAKALENYGYDCAKASLEKASRIAKTYKSGNSGSYYDASIDKLSITQESNIVIL